VSVAADLATLPVSEQIRVLGMTDAQVIVRHKAIRAERETERREERFSRIIEIARGNAALPGSERYSVIYADPPWRYEHAISTSREIENQYPTMSLDEICDLDVAGVATNDAILYVWATAPKLAECIHVIDAWSFSYRTNFVWVKDKLGMGFYTRSQHELLLVATRGNMPAPAPSDRVSSVVHAPRGEHSAKPEVFYEMIESFYPSLPRIELFSRQAREGWSAWGNQAAEAAA
jgi:N6-adenosine-specific RNA methylase IME4